MSSEVCLQYRGSPLYIQKYCLKLQAVGAVRLIGPVIDPFWKVKSYDVELLVHLHVIISRLHLPGPPIFIDQMLKLW